MCERQFSLVGYHLHCDKLLPSAKDIGARGQAAARETYRIQEGGGSV